METRVLFALIPATFALFSLALCLVALVDRRLKAARWGALAFALAAVGVVLDAMRTPGQTWGLFYVHILVVGVFCQALSARHRQRIPLGVIALLVATAVGVSVLKMDGRSLELRQLAFNGGVALSLIVFLYHMINWGHRRPMDRLVIATMLLLILSYLFKISYLFVEPLSDSMSQQSSFFAIGPNLLFHFIMGISGAAAGLLLLGVLAADLMRLQAGRFMVDPLTGVGNRHALDAAIEADVNEEWDCCGAIILDLDHFKQVNDRYGHVGGDRLLESVGAILSRLVGWSGQLFRTGGEEFVVLVEGRHCDRLGEIAEIARDAVSAVRVRRRGTIISATASVGWHRRCEGETIDAMLEYADRGMYAAKAGGRNRVECYQVDEQQGPNLKLVAS